MRKVWLLLALIGALALAACGAADEEVAATTGDAGDRSEVSVLVYASPL